MLQPTVWAAGIGMNKNKWSCLACKDNHWRDTCAACQHEKTTPHQENIGHLLSPRCPSSSPTRPDVRSPLLELLRDLSESPSPLPSQNANAQATELGHHDKFQLDWEAIDHEQLYSASTYDQSLTSLSNSLAAWLANGDDPIPSDEEESDSAAAQYQPDKAELLQPGASCLTQRGEIVAPNSLWFPWPDKQMCILDILQHLPRSLFSDTQLQIILWGFAVLGVDSIPLGRNLKDLDTALQLKYGILSVQYQGSLGHVYYVNHLPSIIVQEMANPCIRPHVRHYPEDAGGQLEQPWQASRWLHEIDPSIATPMICKGHQDFYVFEPTELVDGTMVIPECWYTKPLTMARPGSASTDFEYWAHACQLLLSLPHLLETYEADDLPDPCNIIGLIDARGQGVLPWTFTDPAVRNRWCTQAGGYRVLAYMIWLYCDDTSGNKSKKWNKHNSFLFTAAGLPRHMVHKESNIHFLATSNIAPPLEMLDGIVDQLEHAQTHGIWAWDIEAREMVLLIPAVLAMLGDNPMQSELACRVSLQGKFFCRNCWVKRSESSPSQDPETHMGVVTANDETCSVDSRSNMTESDEGSAQEVITPQTKKGLRSETMQELVDHACCFLAWNPPHTREETVAKLRTMFEDVANGKGKTCYTKSKMDNGIKGTYMDVFVMQILKHVKGICTGTDGYSEAVDTITQGCPVEMFMSPVWRIKGLDSHQDMPVEVLHVILLSFAELQTWLASFDVTPLGIPPLVAQTLVQYAGSLTGQDFHAISQAAPFVLYDLVPTQCYETFVALSALVPLVWQPSINDLEGHLAALQVAIDHFLNCTARWTPQWFNKPKFHIIHHLPDHIHRFGPAILFAISWLVVNS
ncbi:hypothetical protein SCLCIDRAFT_20369 [Scleroderma citrinum Foug A]|uniref:Uncharacterized protein n=1 Tax=Scleroderma citrinum Foug A TaxID=1036808 RepID=A0A0C3A458_9AGAM|nr:hypothetical protein SCLCIDRAFT_20369 [Scleroderma citrinum Foug A]